MNRYSLIFSVLVILFFANAAQAQHALVLQKLNEWNDAAPTLSNEVFKEEISKTASEIYSAKPQCASSEISIHSVHPATADRFVFTSLIRQQLRNAWTVTANLAKCDSAPVRFMVMQSSDDSLRTIRVNRGHSYAHDSLIADTLPLALLAATAKLERENIQCDVKDAFKLGVTRVDTQSQDLGDNIFGVRYKGSWSEIWPIEICNKTVNILIEFTADGDGGAYTKLPGDKVTITSK